MDLKSILCINVLLTNSKKMLYSSTSLNMYKILFSIFLKVFDPESGQHTNTIEGLWRHAKFSLPQFHRKKQFIAGYLAKFMFQKMCKAQKLDPLVEFFKMAGSIYDATKVDSVEID